MSASSSMPTESDKARQALAHFPGSMLSALRGAPGEASRLRDLVLALAFHGRLFDGDRTSQCKHTPSPDGLWALPSTWKWRAVGELGRIVGGGTPKSDDPTLWAREGVAWLTPADLYGLRGKWVERGRRDISDKGLASSSARLLPAGTVLFSSRAPIGYVAIARRDLATNQGFKSCVLSDPALADWLYWYLKYAAKAIDASASGTTFKEISGSAFARVQVPVAPPAERARIVARIEEMMALCDALEDKQRLADEQHARLTSTLFEALAASESAHALAESWRRVAEHFDLLLDRPEAITALERTVLSLAMRGRLVAQQPTPELSMNSKGQGAVRREDVPYVLPESWQWHRLGDVAELVNGDRGKNYPNRAEYVSTGVPFINTGHIEPDGTLNHSSMHFLTRAKFDSLRSGKVRRGDLVYCLRGATLGKTAIVAYEEGAIASSLVIIRLGNLLTGRYAYYYLVSPLGREFIKQYDNGSAQPNLAGSSVARYLVPVPPLAEQHRIVARVEELRDLCAKLRERLNAAREVQARLVDALVDSVA